MNGHSNERYIDTINPEDPEYIKQLRRPADVKCDLQRMDSSTRVSNILQTKDFKDELESLVTQLMPGGGPPSLNTMQKINDILAPHNKMSSGLHGGTTIPISDVRGQDSLQYSKGEKMLRCKIASLFRLVDLHGWAYGINNSITVRISQDLEHFLINPHGLQYHEITASSLAKVDMQGDVVDPGTTNMGIDVRAFTLHAAIHSFRPDIRTVVHLHTQSSVAVSAMKSGLLPICQEAMIIGDCSYFDYVGIISTPEESDKLARALGPHNKVVFLRNHGVVVCGESIEEAFLIAQNVTAACDTQVKLIPVGLDNVVIPGEDVRKQTYDAYLITNAPGTDGKRKWRRGEKEFESLMRQLDNMGFRTGHVYHEPLTRSDQRTNRINADIECPPAATSSGYHDDERLGSPLRQTLERQRDQVRTHWLGTPNAYTKQEIEETGTMQPKKYTKWIAEKDPELRASYAGKTENPNQFAPQGANSRELKNKHQEIRKEYYTDSIHAGPQSKILDGISWEEAERIKDAHVSGTTDTMIVVGAASKGIIQRDHQHNQQVYKSFYQPNPFETMSKEDIDRYQKEVSKDPQIETTVTTVTTHVTKDTNAESLKTTETKIAKSESAEPVISQLTTTVASVNGEDPVSPARSTSSGELSPSKEHIDTPGTDGKKKKKFRIPSFSKKKDKKTT